MRTLIPVIACAVIVIILLIANCDGDVRHDEYSCRYEKESGQYIKGKNYAHPEETGYDLYYPVCTSARNSRAEQEPLPLLIFIHEGAFLPGFDKTNSILAELLSKTLSVRNIAVANIDYRSAAFANERMNIVNDCVMIATQDAHAALSFFHENAKEFNINPNRIFIGGYSAGAITALHTAFYRENEYAGYSNYDNERLTEYASYSSPDEAPIAGVISIAGGLPDANIIDGNDHPDLPILFYHSKNDSIVPCESGVVFKKFTSKTHEVELVHIDWGSYKIGDYSFEIDKAPHIRIPSSFLTLLANTMLPTYYGSCELSNRLETSERGMSIVFEEKNQGHSIVYNKEGKFRKREMNDLTDALADFIKDN